MTSTGYNNRYREPDDAGDQNQANFKTQEKTAHQTSYESLGEDEKTGYQAANQHTAQFLDELKLVNGKSADAFETWGSRINDYGLRERREMVNSYADAMNSVGWNDRDDRKAASLEVAQNTFRPIYEKIDTETAINQYNISKGLEEFLLKSKVEHLERMTLPNGEEILQFKVKNKKAAKKLIEDSGGELYEVPGTFSGKKIEKFQEDFADALTKSDRDPEQYKEKMNEALEKALDYWRGNDYDKGILRYKVTYKNPNEANDEANDEATDEDTGEDVAMLAQVEHRKEDTKNVYADLKGLDEDAREEAVRELVHARMQPILEVQEEFRNNHNQGNTAVDQVIYTMKNTETEQLGHIIEKGSPEDLEKALQDNALRHEEMAHSMRENNGFILMRDYEYPQPMGDSSRMEHPGLQESLRDTAQKYLDDVNQLMESRGSEMPQLQQEMVARMTEDFAKTIKNMEEREDERGIRSYTMAESRYLDQTAEGIQYLLRPHDADFWKDRDSSSWLLAIDERMNDAVSPVLDACPPENLAETTHLRDLLKNRHRNDLYTLMRDHDQEGYREQADEVNGAMTEMLEHMAQRGGVLESQDERFRTNLDFQPIERGDAEQTEARAKELEEYVRGANEAMKHQFAVMNRDHYNIATGETTRFLSSKLDFDNFAPAELTDEERNDLRAARLEHLEQAAHAVHTLTTPMEEKA